MLLDKHISWKLFVVAKLTRSVVSLKDLKFLPTGTIEINRLCRTGMTHQFLKKKLRVH